MIDANRWQSVITLLEDDSVQYIPDYWLLLIASRSLETYQKPNAATAASIAIEKLVKLGRLNMVSGLVDTHGKKVLQNTNFVGKYILADLEFQKLKEQWVDFDSSQLSKKHADYAQVAITLQEALNAEDAHQFNNALSACKLLLAHALYHAGQYAEASTIFSKAADGTNMQEAMWMTIVSLDQLDVRTIDQEQLRDITIEKYITLFPNDTRSNTLKLHRSFYDGTGEQEIDELLSITRNDPIYNEARMRAEDLLYSQWRKTDKAGRAASGTKYLEIAAPALDFEIKNSPKNTSAILSRSRRILEVSLHPAILRAGAAKNIFSILDQLTITDPEVAEELVFRKIQFQLLQDNLAQAVSSAISLLENSPSSQWNTYAAVELLNSIRSSPSHLKDSLRLEYFRIGSSYVGSLKEIELEQAGQFSVATDVVKTGHNIWQSQQDSQTGSIALLLARRLNVVHKQNRILLRLCALLEEGLGEVGVAIDHWRILSSGISNGTPEWFEARYKLIFLLKDQDPESAQQLFSQHKTLYPNYGPAPYDKFFKELEHTLQKTPAALDLTQ